MTIGIAIVIAMVLYLIDRNKVWRQAAKIVGALMLLAVLGVAGIIGWDKYDSRRRAQKDAAEHAAMVAADAADAARDAAKRWATEHPKAICAETGETIQWNGTAWVDTATGKAVAQDACTDAKKKNTPDPYAPYQY